MSYVLLEAEIEDVASVMHDTYVAHLTRQTFLESAHTLRSIPLASCC